MMKRSLPALYAMGIVLWCAAASYGAGHRSVDGTARQMLQAVGGHGGVVVHLGCGDGRLAAAIGADARYVVHGVDADPVEVAAARKHVCERGGYGRISIQLWDKPYLPYAANLVNLLIAEDLGEVPVSEVMRVLTPNGTALIKTPNAASALGDEAGGSERHVASGGAAGTPLEGSPCLKGWTKLVKPRPNGLDDWTHYLHDATGNPVAKDTVVGPPHRMQWTAGPDWSRQHDHLASLPAMVSSAGRVFYVMDEGSRASILLPAKWSLIARDAFNGIVLWKRPIENWMPHLFGFRAGPAALPRRLVAMGDRVYVTLGMDAPVRALDATTGKTIQTYTDTRGTEEMCVSEGVLFTVIDDDPIDWQTFRPKAYRAGSGGNTAYSMSFGHRRASKQTIVAVEWASGKTLWRTSAPVVPLTMAVDGRRLCFHDGGRVVCLDRRNGKPRWRSPPLKPGRLAACYTPRLLIYDNVVLLSNGTQVSGLSAETGERLWSSSVFATGCSSPPDLLVADGMLGFATVRRGRPDKPYFVGLDPMTGRQKKRFRHQGDSFIFMHNRCHLSKATDRYLIPSLTGIEFADLRRETWSINQWVRGGCLYGIMPCNGLLYTPPHNCACFIESKLDGFNALAPKRKEEGGRRKRDRLEKGPAYAGIHPSSFRLHPSTTWPMFRHDAGRSGAASCVVPTDLSTAWSTPIGGRLTQPVVACGILLVASIDAHTVYALDSETGARLWQFTAGARIDSPPTVVAACRSGSDADTAANGQTGDSLCVFGSADGHAYCLRLSDGRLVWRFRAAPDERYVGAHGQLESAWPLHGSLLVLKPESDARGAVVYCLAGRSSYLDGGLRLCRLEAATGRLLSETVLDGRNPTTGKDLLSDQPNMRGPVALPDVLSSNGRSVTMRSQRFDLAGNVMPSPTRAPIEDLSGTPYRRTAFDTGELSGAGAHLFSLNGFLDDSWYRRSYWLYASVTDGACWGWYRPAWYAPAGRILVVDDSRVYGYGRQPEFMANSSVLEYRLFAVPKRPDLDAMRRVAELERETGKPHPLDDWTFRKTQPKDAITALRPDWSVTEMSILVRAMVLTGTRDSAKTLFAAGPPDLVDEQAAYGNLQDTRVQQQLREQDAALDGRRGALVQAMSATDGGQLAEYAIESPPVFDGMIAANGRLYLACMDGRVTCLDAR